MSQFDIFKWDAIKSCAYFDIIPEHMLLLTTYIKPKIHDIKSYVYVYVLI